MIRAPPNAACNILAKSLVRSTASENLKQRNMVEHFSARETEEFNSVFGVTSPHYPSLDTETARFARFQFVNIALDEEWARLTLWIFIAF